MPEYIVADRSFYLYINTNDGGGLSQSVNGAVVGDCVVAKFIQYNLRAEIFATSLSNEMIRRWRGGGFVAVARGGGGADDVRVSVIINIMANPLNHDTHTQYKRWLKDLKLCGGGSFDSIIVFSSNFPSKYSDSMTRDF